MAQHLLRASSILHMDLCQDDVLAILWLIEHARQSGLPICGKVEYLKRRLLQISSKDEWKHSVLNKDEDRALRYWYLTRGNNVPMTEENWETMREEMRDAGYSYVDELSSRCYGIDLENINRSKVIKFANSCVVIKPPKHHTDESKPKKEGKPKGLNLEQMMALLKQMKGQQHNDQRKQ